MKTSILLLSIVFFLGLSCTQNNSEKPAEKAAEDKTEVAKKERPVSLDNGKFFDSIGKHMLYGGENNSQHFNITGYSLKDEQFHYGIGRESFSALLEPEFISVAEADTSWADSTRFLLAHSGNEVKAYSIPDLTHHEVVNDVLDGQPIMAAYCILADLGAIYSRDYGGKVLTFALSGYTYYDEDVWNGLDGFILWDRETESLWWPLIGKAVSGPLKEVKLLEMDESHWEDVQWKYIKEKYPNALVLKSGQDFDRPEKWGKLDNISSIRNNFTAEK